MTRHSNLLYIAGATGILLAIAAYYQTHSVPLMPQEIEKGILTVGDAVLQVEIADTPDKRAAGLSHRAALAEGEGMLFVFEEEGRRDFWMKDMRFPIDIVWISKEREVVHITDSVAPDTYPTVFTSPIPARYVLEVPAGYTRGRIHIGDRVRFREAGRTAE